MEKKHSIALALGLVVLIGALIWWGVYEDQSKPSLDQTVTTYFYGETCPHCRDVQKFLDENDIASKFSFVKREVWSDQSNTRLMREAAGICALDTTKIAVPFVFSEGKCLVGTPDVIGFFKQKAGI